MKKILALLLIVLPFISYSQYELVNEIETNDFISANSNINEIHYKTIGSKMLQIRKIEQNDNGVSYKISVFNIGNGEAILLDTLVGVPASFRINDLSFNDKYLFVTGPSKYFYYNIKDGNEFNIKMIKTFVPKKSRVDPPYTNCHFINDSLILLYTIYNFHPNSHDGGLYLNIFNVNSGLFTTKKYYTFPGILMMNCGVNVLTVTNNRIFTVTPLKGKLMEFDFSLNKLKNVQLNVFEKNQVEKNQAFELSIDSLIASEDARLNKIINTNTQESLSSIPEYKSIIYSKDFIYKFYTEVDSNYTYIDNIFTIDDTLLGITIGSPEDRQEYRRVCIINPRTNKILKEYKAWRCATPLKVSKKEELLTVNLKLPVNQYYYFQGGYIYSGNVFSSKYFFEGESSDISEKIFKDISKNGYKWSILKYRY